MLGQDARDVDRDVSDTDDRDGLRIAAQMHDLAVIGMPAVPGHELGRREAAGEVFARNAEPPIVRRADGVDDRVEVRRRHRR